MGEGVGESRQLGRDTAEVWYCTKVLHVRQPYRQLSGQFWKSIGETHAKSFYLKGDSLGSIGLDGREAFR